MRSDLNIIKAIKDPEIFQPFFGDLESWKAWSAVLRCIYGLPQLDKHRRLVEQCTGRDPGLMPPAGFRTSLLLCGRRSGKSRCVSVVAAFEAVFAGHEKRLDMGEQGLVACVSPTRRQSSIIKSYIRSIFSLPLLEPYLVRETADGFQLKNGISIEIMTGDWRTIRGFTLVAAVVDEICFFGVEEESKIRSDTALIQAIRPSMATMKNSKLICVSSPYAKKGWGFENYERCFSDNQATTLVWNSSSQTMNPTLSDEIVAEAYREDPASARSEFGGEFRDDIGQYLPRETIEQVVVKSRDFISPNLSDKFTTKRGTQYTAFVDLSGGRSDAAALAIGHREGRKVILDLVKHYKAPFVPDYIIQLMCLEIKRYGIHRVYGDAYAAEFAVQSFNRQNVTYEKCDRSKSDLYLNLVPLVTSQMIELLDNELLIKELSSLERRTRSGGRDIVDHPRGSHDDLANACAGLSFELTKTKKTFGLFNY